MSHFLSFFVVMCNILTIPFLSMPHFQHVSIIFEDRYISELSQAADTYIHFTVQ
jgi:hypothetical protein